MIKIKIKFYRDIACILNLNRMDKANYGLQAVQMSAQLD
jgi:hypothetical protein